jgi:hypothetical protein
MQTTCKHHMDVDKILERRRTQASILRLRYWITYNPFCNNHIDD